MKVVFQKDGTTRKMNRLGDYLTIAITLGKIIGTAMVLIFLFSWAAITGGYFAMWLLYQILS